MLLAITVCNFFVKQCYVVHILFLPSLGDAHFLSYGTHIFSIALYLFLLPCLMVPIYLCNSAGKVKKVCETDLGIVSQCLKPDKVERANKQYFENVALKVNVKVGLLAVTFFCCA